MSAIHEYLESCKDVNSVEQLSIMTYQFLKNPDNDVTLFLHHPGPFSLNILHTTNSMNLDEWYRYLSEVPHKKYSLFTSNEKYDYFFSTTNFLDDEIYFFAANQNHPSARDILPVWQSMQAIYQNVLGASKRDTENIYANLISQLMHDIQSLIDSNTSTDKKIIKRINYQKKLNRDLLFFIRDFDIFKTEITLKNFIKDSLHLLDLNPDSIEIKMENENLNLNIDVELFSETFNVVLRNALKAAENDVSKIKINIYSQPADSPFLNLDWVIFEITDFGNGIAEEFEPFIARPFFTTHKHDGHTGFGLSNAQKILKAHKGFWEISTGKGTKVKIYLPQKYDEQK